MHERTFQIHTSPDRYILVEEVCAGARARMELFSVCASKTNKLLVGCATWPRRQRKKNSVARDCENVKMLKVLRECTKIFESTARMQKVLKALRESSRNWLQQAMRETAEIVIFVRCMREHLRIFLWACAKSQTIAKLASLHKLEND